MFINDGDMNFINTVTTYTFDSPSHELFANAIVPIFRENGQSFSEIAAVFLIFHEDNANLPPVSESPEEFSAAVSPIVFYLVWGIKAVLGFVFGLIAAEAFLFLAQLYQAAGSSDRRGVSIAEYSIVLFVVAGELTAIQFVEPLLDLEMTRAAKIWALGVAVLVGLAWFGVTAIAARRRA